MYAQLLYTKSSCLRVSKVIPFVPHMLCCIALSEHVEHNMLSMDMAHTTDAVL